MCPSTIFKWKYKFYLVILNIKVWNFWNPFLVKITMVNFVFHLKSDEGHIERFSFDVYMSPLPIFTKIKHPFAWHISFLVRHLSKYSDKLIQHFFMNFQHILGNPGIQRDFTKQQWNVLASDILLAQKQIFSDVELWALITQYASHCWYSSYMIY